MGFFLVLVGDHTEIWGFFLFLWVITQKYGFFSCFCGSSHRKMGFFLVLVGQNGSFGGFCGSSHNNMVFWGKNPRAFVLDKKISKIY